MQLVTEQFVVEEGLDQRYEVLKELGDCHTSLGNYDRARQCYDEAGRLAPDRTGPHVGRGVIALQSGRLDEATDAFDRALRLDEACSEARGGLAMVHQARQDYPAAFELYLACLEKNPDNLVALLGLFQTSCQMGSFAKIIHYLRLYLDRHPGDTSVLFCLATLQARDGRLGEAEEVLLRILALEPENGEAADLLDEVRRKAEKATAEVSA